MKISLGAWQPRSPLFVSPDKCCPGTPLRAGIGINCDICGPEWVLFRLPSRGIFIGRAAPYSWHARIVGANQHQSLPYSLVHGQLSVLYLYLTSFDDNFQGIQF